MLANLRSVVAEGIYLAMEEPPWSTQELADLVLKTQEHSLIAVAEVDGHVVGDCWMMRGKLAKTRHTCSLGMHVIKSYRGLGVGASMVKYVLG